MRHHYDADQFIHDCTPHFVHSCALIASRSTGKERDSESGLDNFGKRYYASSMGRFSSTDPGPYIWRDPQTLNRYTYTRNNPLRYVDPTGMYFVVAAEMQAQVKQYISTMLRSPEGAAMIRAISANPKPNFFSQGALDRHQVPGTNQIAVTNGTTTALAGNQPGQVAGTQTTLSNSNIAFTAGMSTGDIFAVGLKAFAHEDSHVVDINAAHTLQGAAAGGWPTLKVLISSAIVPAGGCPILAFFARVGDDAAGSEGIAIRSVATPLGRGECKCPRARKGVMALTPAPCKKRKERGTPSGDT